MQLYYFTDDTNKTHNEFNEYDKYGNIVKHTIKEEDTGYEKTCISTYKNKEVLDELLIYDNGNLARIITFFWDDHGNILKQEVYDINYGNGTPHVVFRVFEYIYEFYQ